MYIHVYNIHVELSTGFYVWRENKDEKQEAPPELSIAPFYLHQLLLLYSW